MKQTSINSIKLILSFKKKIFNTEEADYIRLNRFYILINNLYDITLDCLGWSLTSQQTFKLDLLLNQTGNLTITCSLYQRTTLQTYWRKTNLHHNPRAQTLHLRYFACVCRKTNQLRSNSISKF